MEMSYSRQQTHVVATVYEVPETHAVGNSERPYAFGRPSEGGGSNAYPCKNYDQARLAPLYYYNDFDPADMRRDVTCAITGSDGKGAEKLINFKKGSRTSGGIGLNKWDENRMTMPWTAKQRQSGINNPFMRFADIILMQAEVKAALGKDGEARTYLDMIRNLPKKPIQMHSLPNADLCSMLVSKSVSLSSVAREAVSGTSSVPTS